MRDSDHEQFSELLADVVGFYGQTVSRFAMGVWWQACQGFDLEQVRAALTAHAMDPERGHFAPKPADLVRQLQGTQTDRALVAWGKVLQAMQRVGAYSSVAFDDPAIHAVVEDLGGWPKLCREPMDALPHVQRRFCEAHRVYSRRPDLSFPAKLVGQHEAENRLQGRSVAPAVLVGNPDRARLVMRRGTSQTSRVPMALDVPGAVARIGAAREAA